MHWGKIFICSFLAFDLTWMSTIVGVSCKMVPPGGISEGWSGLPVPFVYCGVWGETTSWAIAILDFLFWAFIVYLFIKGDKLSRPQSKYMVLAGALLILSAIPYYLLFNIAPDISRFLVGVVVGVIPISFGVGVYTILAKYNRKMLLVAILLFLANLVLLSHSLFGLG